MTDKKQYYFNKKIECNGTVYILKQPIFYTVQKRNNYLEARCRLLDLTVTGLTVLMCRDELITWIAHLYDRFNELSDGQLNKTNLRIKQIFNSIIKETIKL